MRAATKPPAVDLRWRDRASYTDDGYTSHRRGLWRGQRGRDGSLTVWEISGADGPSPEGRGMRALSPERVEVKDRGPKGGTRWVPWAAYEMGG